MPATKASCWCSARQIQAEIEGELEGKRAAEILAVTLCTQGACPKRCSTKCLIGKEIEARWP